MKWSDEERAIVAEAAGKMTTAQLAHKLGRPQPEVRRFCNRNKIAMRRHTWISDPAAPKADRLNRWDDRTIALLTKLWLEGKSAPQVAKAIGDGCTRGAVIGKVGRLGLQRPAEVVRQSSALNAIRRHRGQHSTPPKAGKAPPLVLILPPAQPPTPNTFAVVTMLTFDHRRHCGWGLGGEGADTLFCAEPKDGQRFCSHHKTIGVTRTVDGLKRLPAGRTARRGEKTTGLALRVWGGNW